MFLIEHLLTICIIVRLISCMANQFFYFWCAGRAGVESACGGGIYFGKFAAVFFLDDDMMLLGLETMGT